MLIRTIGRPTRLTAYPRRSSRTRLGSTWLSGGKQNVFVKQATFQLMTVLQQSDHGRVLVRTSAQHPHMHANFTSLGLGLCARPRPSFGRLE